MVTTSGLPDLLKELSVAVSCLHPGVDVELLRGWVLHTEGDRLHPLLLLDIQHTKMLPV